MAQAPDRFSIALNQLERARQEERRKARNCEYAKVYRDKRAAGIPKRKYTKHGND